MHRFPFSLVTLVKHSRDTGARQGVLSDIKLPAHTRDSILQNTMQGMWYDS